MKVVVFCRKGGGNRLGEKLFDEQVNIWADPWNPEVSVLPAGMARCCHVNASM